MSKDSLRLYFLDADCARLSKPRERVAHGLFYWNYTKRRKMLTVDHGDAILGYNEPGDPDNKKGTLFLILSLLDKLKPAELRKREAEMIEGIKAIIKSSFGERVKDMLEIRVLATSPAKQGRGYGTALVKVVNDLADGQGRATFVVTTDAYRFYETVGYRLVGEVWLGTDNPKWHGGPVPLRVMVREPGPAVGQMDSEKDSPW